MVHTAVGYARQRNRLATFACTTSIGPGATNMITGAALATVNRLPVLLLPGDVFASRRPDPALQQLELPWAGDISVNDVFRPVSKYFDRIWRAEQVVPAALQAMRVLVNQAETGAVTLAFPQDVQAEAFDVPDGFLEKRVWLVGRPLPDAVALARAAELIRASKRPLIVAGGGVIYSEATEALRSLCERTGIPVCETQAGKGSLPYDHPSALGAVGVTGTFAANRCAAQADLVIGVGTRWSDFTTASKTAFRALGVRFVNVNVADFDAAKHAGLALVGDARATLERLAVLLRGYEVDRERAARLNREWDAEVSRLYALEHEPPAQSAVIGAVNAASRPQDVVVCAAGSMPGDLHKLWRTRDPKGYHVEYGYSCMGYEIAGGLGVKLAAPEREVYVLVGDGSYLMLSSELVTAVQERLKLTIVLVDNRGYSSIGSLSRSLGTDGFGTLYRYRSNGSLGVDSEGSTDYLPVDLAANAASLGAKVIRARSIDELRAGLEAAKTEEGPVVIAVEVDRYEGVPSYESWWDVAVSEVSEVPTVRDARERYEAARVDERSHV
jgi:3D-(3,5/4)-trihydroxycyclohexane-1,2-dione acylhydrolase (decyclizing)